MFHSIQLILEKVFTRDGLSSLWNELVKDGELTALNNRLLCSFDFLKPKYLLQLDSKLCGRARHEGGDWSLLLWPGCSQLPLL